MEVIIIVAKAKNNTIGNKGRIPWHIKKDFQRFKRLTKGYPVIMGRKTYESLPIRPLPGRTNIILTRNQNYKPSTTKNEYEEEIIISQSLPAAIKICEEKGVDKAYIIGGARVYEEGLKFADTLELTELSKEYEGDTKFPEIDREEWELIKSEPEHDDKEGDYWFNTYKRKTKEDR